MNKAARLPWTQMPPAADLICAQCATAKDVAVQKDSALDISLWHLWCSRCGHEWTVPKPARG